MLPYFPTMSPLLESGRRRAKMSWESPWSKYPGYENSTEYVSQGHPAYARWMTDLEHVEIGPGATGMPMMTPETITTKGGYDGAQMICAMGPWANMGQWSECLQECSVHRSPCCHMSSDSALSTTLDLVCTARDSA